MESLLLPFLSSTLHVFCRHRCCCCCFSFACSTELCPLKYSLKDLIPMNKQDGKFANDIGGYKQVVQAGMGK